MSLQLVTQTLILITAVCAVSLVVGCVTALGAWLTSKPFRNVIVAGAILNLVLPQFMFLTYWMGLFGEAGSLRPWLDWNLYSMSGAVWMCSFLYWPIPFLCALGTLERMHPHLLEVEPELRNFNLCRHLLWPAARPALIGGMLVVVALTLNQFNVPSLLQIKTWTADLFVTFSATLEWREIQSSILWLIGSSSVVLLCLKTDSIRWPFGRHDQPQLSASRHFDSHWVWGLKGAAGLWFITATVLPCLGLLFSKQTWADLRPALAAGQSAFNNSLIFSTLTATFSLILGGALHRWKGAKILWLLFLLPGCVWGVIFLSLTQQTWFPLHRPHLSMTILALTLRYAALGWLGVHLARQILDRSLVDAGRLDAPSVIQRARILYLPQIGWLLGAAWYLVFLFSLWDADTLLFVTPPGADTLALRIFNLLHYGHNSQVHAMTLLLLMIAILPWAITKGCHLAKSVPKFWNHAMAIILTSCVAGCSNHIETKTPNEALLDSRIFEKAIIIGTQGRSPGFFIKPRSLTVDREDYLYVVDMTGRVQKFDQDGNYVLQWQMPELERGKPKGMCLDAEGNIVVVEPHYSRVNHFTSEGKLIRQWGAYGKDEGLLTFPRSAALQSDGTLVISEYQAAERVQRFTADGSICLGSTGTIGNQPGQFNRPEGLACNPADDIFVADSCNHRIQVLDPAGNWKRSFGQAGHERGELSYPYDLAIDDAGNLFVCEFGNSRLQVFNQQDESIEILGGPGDAPGQLNNPWSIALDSKGNLYIADAANHRVQKWVRRRDLTFNKATGK